MKMKRSETYNEDGEKIGLFSDDVINDTIRAKEKAIFSGEIKLMKSSSINDK